MKAMIMIAATELPNFERGDIITIQPEGGGFGTKTVGNPKFLSVVVDGISQEEAETFVEPLATYNGRAEQFSIIKQRKYNVDIAGMGVDISVNDLLGRLSEKVTNIDIQAGDVIV